MTEHEKAVHIINCIVCASGGFLKPEDYICIKDASEKLDVNQLNADLKLPSVPENYIRVAEIS